MDKELKKRCERISHFFDTLAREGTYGTLGEEFPISNFVSAYPELKAIGINERLQDTIAELFTDLGAIAFALGFVIGSRYEVTYPEAKEDIEAIEKVIREKGLLPYVPREKVAA